jgi:hypothetical protein
VFEESDLQISNCLSGITDRAATDTYLLVRYENPENEQHANCISVTDDLASFDLCLKVHLLDSLTATYKWTVDVLILSLQSIVDIVLIYITGKLLKLAHYY